MLKDPIRIHPRQLKELKRLVGDRIAPKDDPVMSCQPDTAGKVTRDDSVLNEDGRGRVVDIDTARPCRVVCIAARGTSTSVTSIVMLLSAIPVSWWWWWHFLENDDFIYLVIYNTQ